MLLEFCTWGRRIRGNLLGSSPGMCGFARPLPLHACQYSECFISCAVAGGIYVYRGLPFWCLLLPLIPCGCTGSGSPHDNVRLGMRSER